MGHRRDLIGYLLCLVCCTAYGTVCVRIFHHLIDQVIDLRILRFIDRAHDRALSSLLVIDDMDGNLGNVIIFFPIACRIGRVVGSTPPIAAAVIKAIRDLFGKSPRILRNIGDSVRAFQRIIDTVCHQSLAPSLHSMVCHILKVTGEVKICQHQ